jgi:hypothetical protein
VKCGRAGQNKHTNAQAHQPFVQTKRKPGHILARSDTEPSLQGAVVNFRQVRVRRRCCPCRIPYSPGEYPLTAFPVCPCVVCPPCRCRSLPFPACSLSSRPSLLPLLSGRRTDRQTDRRRATGQGDASVERGGNHSVPRSATAPRPHCQPQAEGQAQTQGKGSEETRGATRTEQHTSLAA